jgi:hypothetical protein
MAFCVIKIAKPKQQKMQQAKYFERSSGIKYPQKE